MVGGSADAAATAAHADSDVAGDAATPRSTAFALRVCGVIMVSGLFLQRLAVPAGDAKIHLASIVTILTVLYGLIMRRLRLSVPSSMAYLMMLAAVCATYLINSQLLFRPGVRFSDVSMLHFLALFALFTVRFSRPVDQLRIFGLYQNLILIIVLCGFAQFTLQFVGLEFFSFRPYISDDYLVEPIFNTVIPITGGSGPYKANGMFLVEPSVFSQVTAVAIAIEIACFRRPLRLMLLSGGMLIAVSGTGMIVLAVFFLIFLMNPQHVRLSEIFGIGLAIACVGAIAYLTFPEIFERFAERADEFQDQGSSGHIRFTSIWTGLVYTYNLYPDYLLWGVGPGSAEALTGGPRIGINTLTKVIIEYGVIVFAIWFYYHVSAAWHRHLAMVVVPALLFLWTGGTYQQFGPVIVLVLGLLALNPYRETSPARGGAGKASG